MKRVTLVIWMAVLVVSAVALFHVKYKVQYLKRELAEVHRQLAADQDAMHVLQAEWSYLNQPERLKTLSEKYLKLKPIEVAQIRELDYQEMMNVARADNNFPVRLSEIKGYKEKVAISSSPFYVEETASAMPIFPIRKPQDIPLKVRE